MQLIGIFSQPDEKPMKPCDRFQIVPINSITRSISPIIRLDPPALLFPKPTFEKQSTSTNFEEKTEPDFKFSKNLTHEKTHAKNDKIDELVTNMVPIKDVSPSKYLREKSLITRVESAARKKSSSGKTKKRKSDGLLRTPSSFSFVSKDS